MAHENLLPTQLTLRCDQLLLELLPSRGSSDPSVALSITPLAFYDGHTSWVGSNATLHSLRRLLEHLVPLAQTYNSSGAAITTHLAGSIGGGIISLPLDLVRRLSSAWGTDFQ